MCVCVGGGGGGGGGGGFKSGTSKLELLIILACPDLLCCFYRGNIEGT